MPLQKSRLQRRGEGTHQEGDSLADELEVLPGVAHPFFAGSLDPALHLSEARLHVLSIAEAAALTSQQQLIEQLHVDEAEQLLEQFPHLYVHKSQLVRSRRKQKTKPGEQGVLTGLQFDNESEQDHRANTMLCNARTATLGTRSLATCGYMLVYATQLPSAKLTTGTKSSQWS